MHKIMTAGAVGLLLSVPLSSQAAVSEAEVAELRQQVQALLERVQQLETRNAELAGSGAAAPAVRMEALEVRVAEVEEANDRQSDQMAQAAVQAKKVDWASKIKWKGDMRYRHEMIDEESRDTRTRHRIRIRTGLEAKVSDSMTAYVGIATGDPEDPRSTNVTLGGGNVRKSLGIDYGYLAWRPTESTALSLGKMKYPFERFGGSLFYDGDVNPEGGALQFRASNGVFVNGYGFWITESSGGADANLLGAQLGWESPFGLMIAATYNDYGAIQYNSLGISLDSSEPLGGNSYYLAGTSCSGAGTTACYLYDYDIVEVGAEYAFSLGRWPMKAWVNYLRNTAVDDLNEGYNIGFVLGKASNPGSWELAALYQDVERDAQWAGVIDSDFAGGTTQGKGMQFKGAWVPVKNVAVNLTWFENTRNYDTARERDYQRLQLDLSMKF